MKLCHLELIDLMLVEGKYYSTQAPLRLPDIRKTCNTRFECFDGDMTHDKYKNTSKHSANALFALGLLLMSTLGSESTMQTMEKKKEESSFPF